MVKLLVASFPNSKAFFTLFSSLGFRPIATTPTAAATIKKLAFSYRFNIARASSSSIQTQASLENFSIPIFFTLSNSLTLNQRKMHTDEFGEVYIRTLQNRLQGSLLLHRSFLCHGQPPPFASW